MKAVPIKYVGGKNYLAARYHEIAAPHKHHPLHLPLGWIHRVIPFAGGLGEFWEWDYEGVSELVNDLDGRLTNFYEVLREEISFREFARLCEVTPFSEPLWQKARDHFRGNQELSSVESAHLFFVLCRQSMMGAQKSFAPISRNRIRRGQNEQVSAWWGAVDGLWEVHQRLRRVVIKNEDGLSLLKKEDGVRTLFFIDPPYEPSTRQTGMYSREMTADDHERLLDVLLSLKGYVMLCGYESALYESRLAGWQRVVFDVPSHMSVTSTKRNSRECLWLNGRFQQIRRVPITEEIHL